MLPKELMIGKKVVIKLELKYLIRPNNKMQKVVLVS